MTSNTKLSPRLRAIVDALPLEPGMRVLEIGCGPGAAAREIAKRIGNGHILAIDRSEKAIRQAVKNSQDEMESGALSFHQIAIENFESEPEEELFDMAFAIRVGALDGRHPKTGIKAFPRIKKALKQGGLFIDGGNPVREIDLGAYK